MISRAMAILAILMMQCSLWAGSSGGTPLPGQARLTDEDGFLNTGKIFRFPGADGTTLLSGIRFDHPASRGMIVVVNGRAESWLKYGEIFRELYRAGYSVASYDHRGQGLSPRFGKGDPGASRIGDPSLYSADLEAFVRALGNPGPGGFLLLAHSMGAAAALGSLEGPHPPRFRAAVLLSPMTAINTAPWPDAAAPLLTGGLCVAGRGGRYAPGEHDHDPAESFEGNKLTSDRDRWNAMQSVWIRHPEATLGGPSNAWVFRIISWTRALRNGGFRVKTPVLMLLAGQDRLVINTPTRLLARKMPGVRILEIPESRHEILFERDSLRGPALREILRFFVVTSPNALDQPPGNSHSSGATSPNP